MRYGNYNRTHFVEFPHYFTFKTIIYYCITTNYMTYACIYTLIRISTAFPYFTENTLVWAWNLIENTFSLQIKKNKFTAHIDLIYWNIFTQNSSVPFLLYSRNLSILYNVTFLKQVYFGVITTVRLKSYTKESKVHFMRALAL